METRPQKNDFPFVAPPSPLAFALVRFVIGAAQQQTSLDHTPFIRIAQ